VRKDTIELPEPGELSDGGEDVFVTNEVVPDVADLYAPFIPGWLLPRYTNAFPIVVVLQGANVDKEQYSILGKRLARLGMIAVIPNSFQTFGGEEVLFSDVQVVPRAIAAVSSEAADPDSPIYGIADTDIVGAVGHSLGGAAAVYAAANECVIGLCEGCLNPFGCPDVFARPDALKAVAVYGTNLLPPPPAPPVLPDLSYDKGIPIAFLSGSVDGVSPPLEIRNAYSTVEPASGSPSIQRALVSIVGANHYGINDENNPAGALPDTSPPELPQRWGASQIAQAIAVWLRWHLTDDPLAEYWYTTVGASLDGVVVVDALELVDTP
jgi:dienelactone hydrolase